MIRLCSIQPVAERGGSDQALLRMLRSLPAEFERHVVVPTEPPLRAEYEATGTTVHIVAMRRISTSHGLLDWIAYALGWPFAVARLRRLIRRLEVDVVHTNSLHSWYGWAAARFAHRPHVWHAREIVVQSGLALSVERFLTRRFATRVVCGSQAIADQLDAPNTVVIYDAPDPERFSPERAGRFRGGAGIPETAPLVGVAGRLDTWKGIDVLLDAWPKVKDAQPDAQLVIAGGVVQGKERYAADLERRARTLPDVHWLGEVDEAAVAELLADLDVLAAPSTEPEPFGLVAVEALMSATPVVGTDDGGLREIARHATEGAVTLVPRRDPDALADALGRVLAAPREARPGITLPPGDLAAVFRDAAQADGATK
jgi:glycosyltransferase involved in cell wall biosynthesis